MMSPRRIRPAGWAAAAAIPLFLAVHAGAAHAATLSGFVRSASDGEALAYASVGIEGTRLGDATNTQGFYSITGIPAGTWTVAFRYLGYVTSRDTITVAADSALTRSVELAVQPVRVEEVEVEAEARPTYATGRLALKTHQLTRMPTIGEKDLFRAVQALPGVSTLSDFSSGLYVRGGSPDQNLILLDDTDVYNPSHLFGFFSTFNVDAVKTVELQKSGFPARYGGRLSSLLDVHNREGNRKEFEGVGRTGLIASSLTLEGPWSRGSWMISGRRTNLGLITRAADIDLPYAFYDFHTRVNLDAGPGDRTSLSFFKGNDRLDWERSTVDVLLDWGNDTGSLQWTHVFNRRVFSHFLVGGSRFVSRAEVAFQDFEFRQRNEIRDVTAKGALSYKPGPQHMIDFGFETKALDFTWRQDIGKGDRLQFDFQGVYGALYVQDDWTRGDLWHLVPGYRLDWYSEGGYWGSGPRLSVQRMLTEDVALRGTWGRYHQYLNLVAQEGASFADMWFPVDGTLGPGRADHYILGLDLDRLGHFDLSVEGYYKDYDNLVEFSEEFGRSVVQPDTRLGEVFNSGTGHAYGADVYLRNHLAGWEGWVGYAWGKSRRQVELYNRGAAYTPTYDRTHQVTVMQSHPLGRKWMLDLSFRYGSGQPTTLAAGRYTVKDATGRSYDVVLDGPLNGNRLPAFHRLDVGVSRSWQFRGWSLQPSLEVINLYNRKNVYIRTYDLTRNPAVFDDITMLPLIPTVNLDVRF